MDDEKTLVGFYSASPASITYEQTLEIVTRGLSRHDVPVYCLARIAVDLSFQGQGLGGQLLLTAGGVGLLIDAKNARVTKWYASYGAFTRSWIPLYPS